ncbi:MAG: YetF domain-containing protein, partial [Moorellaceae bacterium]
GEILFQNLRQNNLDEKWLEQQLRAQGVQEVSQVDYAVLRSNGSLYINLKKDDLTNPVDITDAPESPVKVTKEDQLKP